ncbi:uncharacterized protein [Linepithema humile]|uniref:uncharacterized protein n=1 Tax=Linepithema humile TaxID=83485 RepID=UPI00351F7B0A
MLIGADIYGSFLKNDVRQGPLGTPIAQSTALGWILSGPTKNRESASEKASVLNCVLTQDVNSLLQRFWEDEEISLSPLLTEEEERCERHFDDTHSRSQDGRYVVRLPFKNAPPIDIGDSLSIALSCYNRLEKRLQSRAEIRSQYRNFLDKYRSLGHMKPVASTDRTDFIPVYIPHYPVLREASCTAKLRVVFNASCKTRNGSSLNDHLLIGLKLQQDLPAVLLRWRQWCYVYTADIAKMFRQIRIHPLDADFQRIFGPSDDSPILHFRLLTVMYGLAPAPYLAMRVLKQLALDEGNAYPSAVSILQDSIYVDDALFGADDELWLLRCDWDAPLPDTLLPRWSDYVAKLEGLNEIRIPRWTGQHPSDLAYEIHGFADASSRAYAAVVYLRVLHSLSSFQILLVAKTKVAPVKTVSILRLELNAVVLLSRLIKWTLSSLQIPSTSVYGWTDSSITLAWVRQHASNWTTYVANRVSEIQSNLSSGRWNHVPSKDNPADCASRGLSASELLSHPLWWTEPSWLRQLSTSWPIHDVSSPVEPDVAQIVLADTRKSVALYVEGNDEWDLLHRCSMLEQINLCYRVRTQIRHALETKRRSSVLHLFTKAIHLELVEDYSMAGFLAAFKRFCSRRGLPKRLYSDNGTNFRGANHELKRYFDALVKEPALRDVLIKDGVDWHFISAAPHFGGLWEAGVKSFKTHLRRIAGARTLSQTEFATLLCLIEACLNSRPIAALSDDPSDLSALTPGDFLIG